MTVSNEQYGAVRQRQKRWATSGKGHPRGKPTSTISIYLFYLGRMTLSTANKEGIRKTAGLTVITIQEN